MKPWFPEEGLPRKSFRFDNALVPVIFSQSPTEIWTIIFGFGTSNDFSASQLVCKWLFNLFWSYIHHMTFKSSFSKVFIVNTLNQCNPVSVESLFWPWSATDYLLQCVRPFCNLRSLSMPMSQGLTPESIKQISHLKKLTYLDLTYCTKSGDQALEYATTLKHLQYLKLRGCCITNKGTETLAVMTNLKKLDLSYCPMITSQGYERLVGLRNLVSFTCSGTEFFPLPQIEALCIRGNGFPAGGETIKNMTNLKSLKFCFCISLTSSMLGVVVDCLTNLKHLHINHCMSLMNLAFLKSLKGLQQLHISDCPSIPKEALLDLEGMEPLVVTVK